MVQLASRRAVPRKRGERGERGEREKGSGSRGQDHGSQKRKRAVAAGPRLRLDVDVRRAQLVALGLEHFGSRAYDDVSIDAIAEAAGISKGLLYHYFPTKRAFYKATVREAASLLLRCTVAADDLPPLERLSQGLDAYLDYVRAHGRAYAALMRSGVGMDPDIAEVVDETRRAFVARLTDGFEPQRGQTGPGGSPPPSLVRIALRGWVGLAETVSVAWAEELIADPEHAPDRASVRDLLSSALLEIAASAAKAAE